MAEIRTMALVGGDTLMGREIRDLLSAEPGVDLKLIAGEDEEAGTLTEQAGEPAVITGLEMERLRGASVVFLAGSAESTRKALAMGMPGRLIDLTYATEDDPRARLRAPLVEPAGYRAPSGTVQVIAHPAAIALALFFDRLHALYPVAESVVNIFEPASERGGKGLEELQRQTVSLLSFKGMPKEVFDAQLSFNLLARYGEEAPLALEDAELRIERHLATLLAHSGRVPLPSLRLIQAPVFHGHSFSLWVDLESNPGAEVLESALAAEPLDVRGRGLEPPNIVGMAGQGGVAIGAVATDRNRESACWFWMVADNLRLAAENAVAVAREAA